MSAYDLQAARYRLRAFFNRRARCAATLYARQFTTVSLAQDLFDRLYLAYPDPARQACICYCNTYVARSCDWSFDPDAPSQPALPASEPAEVTAWVELWNGDVRHEVAFTPDEVRCLMVFVDRDWNETLLKDIPLPYEDPHMLDGIDQFLAERGWPVRLPTIATQSITDSPYGSPRSRRSVFLRVAALGATFVHRLLHWTLYALGLGALALRPLSRSLQPLQLGHGNRVFSVARVAVLLDPTEVRQRLTLAPLDRVVHSQEATGLGALVIVSA
jgi:hypothetical protein